MKAVILNGRKARGVRESTQKSAGEETLARGFSDSARLARLLLIAQEMGGPLNVVIGRMEYLLAYGKARDTSRSLKAILSEAERLVDLRRQLMEETRQGLGAEEYGQVSPPTDSSIGVGIVPQVLGGHS